MTDVVVDKGLDSLFLVARFDTSCLEPFSAWVNKGILDLLIDNGCRDLLDT